MFLRLCIMQCFYLTLSYGLLLSAHGDWPSDWSDCDSISTGP